MTEKSAQSVTEFWTNSDPRRNQERCLRRRMAQIMHRQQIKNSLTALEMFVCRAAPTAYENYPNAGGCLEWMRNVEYISYFGQIGKSQNAPATSGSWPRILYFLFSFVVSRYLFQPNVQLEKVKDNNKLRLICLARIPLARAFYFLLESIKFVKGENVYVMLCHCTNSNE